MAPDSARFGVYAIAHGATKEVDLRWTSVLRDSLGKPLEGSANESMEKLRKCIQELEKQADR